MGYALFLDDERSPKTDRDFVVKRSYKEAVDYVEQNGLPNYISFDHDLGTCPDGSIAPTGYDFAKWLVSYMLDNDLRTMFTYNVHSANPVGVKNITGYLEGYVAFCNR